MMLNKVFPCLYVFLMIKSWLQWQEAQSRDFGKPMANFTPLAVLLLTARTSIGWRKTPLNNALLPLAAEINYLRPGEDFASHNVPGIYLRCSQKLQQQLPKDSSTEVRQAAKGQTTVSNSKVTTSNERREQTACVLMTSCCKSVLVSVFCSVA